MLILIVFGIFKPLFPILVISVFHVLDIKKFRQLNRNLGILNKVGYFIKVCIHYRNRKCADFSVLYGFLAARDVYCYSAICKLISIVGHEIKAPEQRGGKQRRVGRFYGRACLRRIGGFDRHGSGCGGKVVLAYFYCFRCPRRGHAALGRQLAALRRFCRLGRRWLRLQQIGFIQYHYARLLI